MPSSQRIQRFHRSVVRPRFLRERKVLFVSGNKIDVFLNVALRHRDSLSTSHVSQISPRSIAG